MTMQAVLDLDVGDKANVTFSAVAFTVAGINQVVVYVNLAAGNAYRDMETFMALQRISDYVRENGYLFENAVTPIYIRTALAAPKSKIFNDASLASIGVGEVGVGIGQNAPWTSSSKLQVRIKEIIEAMREAERIYA